jgi:hypothetical protein
MVFGDWASGDDEVDTRLQETKKETSALPLPVIGGQNKKSAVWEPVKKPSPDSESVCTLPLNSSTFRL